MFRALQASSSSGARQLHTSASAKAGWETFLPSFLRKQSPSTSSTSESSASESGSSSGQGAVVSTSLFDEVAEQAARSRRAVAKEHRYSTAPHKISPRKLNMLSRQIAGLPIDEAIVQMQFSEKRASKWIKSTLCLARDHAMDKGLSRDKLIVGQTWTNKGQYIKRLDVKGRGRAGIKHHPTAKLHLVLQEGKTQMEKQEARFKKELGTVRSAGVVREDGVLRRKVVSGWAW